MFVRPFNYLSNLSSVQFDESLYIIHLDIIARVNHSMVDVVENTYCYDNY